MDNERRFRIDALGVTPGDIKPLTEPLPVRLTDTTSVLVREGGTTEEAKIEEAKRTIISGRGEDTGSRIANALFEKGVKFDIEYTPPLEK